MDAECQAARRKLRDLTPLSPFSRIQDDTIVFAKGANLRNRSFAREEEESIASLHSIQTADSGFQAPSDKPRVSSYVCPAGMRRTPDEASPMEQEGSAFSQVFSQSMASCGPAALELAQLIHNSQMQIALEQQAAFATQAQYLQSMKSRFMAPSPRFNPPFQCCQPIAPTGHSLVGAQVPFMGFQRAPSAPLAVRYLPEPKLDSLLPRPPPALSPIGGLDPTSLPSSQSAASAELAMSVQLLQKAQRLSALACHNISKISKSSLDDMSKHSKRGLCQLSASIDQQLDTILAEGKDPATRAACQKCALCGSVSTPVWRRLGVHMVCNACGLRNRRSLLLSTVPHAKKQKVEVTGPAPSTRAPLPDRLAPETHSEDPTISS